MLRVQGSIDNNLPHPELAKRHPEIDTMEMSSQFSPSKRARYASNSANHPPLTPQQQQQEDPNFAQQRKSPRRSRTCIVNQFAGITVSNNNNENESRSKAAAIITQSSALSALTSGTSDGKKLFAYSQVVALCEKVLKEQRERLREEYEESLKNKLCEQYDTFLRFTHDQIYKTHGSKHLYTSYLS